MYSQSVYIELGDYQTLLRPMKHLVEESEETADDDPNACAVGDGVDDAPPTPTSYGDDTLRAMAVITQKYDSFRRRQMRVRSFLVSRLSRSTSRDSTCALDDSIADTLRRDASNTLNRCSSSPGILITTSGGLTTRQWLSLIHISEPTRPY